MNRSTFSEIKYMNRLSVCFKGLVYDWGWFQNTDSPTRTNVTPSPPPMSFKRFTFSLCKLSAIIFFATSCTNNAKWMMRYHLDILYSNEAHPAACAMMETGAMSITIP